MNIYTKQKHRKQTYGYQSEQWEAVRDKLGVWD